MNKQPSPAAYREADAIIWGHWPDVTAMVKEIADKTKQPPGYIAMKLQSAMCRRAAWFLEGCA